MATFQDDNLHELMADYVRQHKLQLRCLNLAVWEDFRRIIGVSQTAEWLHEEYRTKLLRPELDCPDLDTEGVRGDLDPNDHFQWCNDMREGLQKKGICVSRNIPVNANLFDTLNCSDSSTTTECMPADTTKTRSKKNITPMERYAQIKRNLAIKQKRRLSTRSSQSN